jgi:hypothetical protein
MCICVCVCVCVFAERYTSGCVKPHDRFVWECLCVCICIHTYIHKHSHLQVYKYTLCSRSFQSMCAWVFTKAYCLCACMRACVRGSIKVPICCNGADTGASILLRRTSRKRSYQRIRYTYGAFVIHIVTAQILGQAFY